MIVKNESKIIKRCLDSVKKYIDYWVIVDTGSTDGTQGIIKKHLKGIPGELHESEFVSFGHNRNESLKLSKDKGQYILLMDADLELKVIVANFKQDLINENKDVYLLVESDGITKDGSYKGFNYRNRIIIKNKLNWMFRGSTHEVVDTIDADKSPNTAIYDGAWIHNRYDGGSKSEKFTRDIKLLTKDLKENPSDDRSMFYLGESYLNLALKEGIDSESERSNELLETAVYWYTKRSEMKNTWTQEIFYSLLKIAKTKTLLNGEIDVLGYLRAYNYKTSRLEPVWEILKHCRENELYTIGYMLGKTALENKEVLEDDALFVNGDVYLYQLLDEFSICASWSGHYKESIETIESIIPKIEGEIDKENEDRIKENLKICRELQAENV
jgi:glycosyltransferase involved in cell wall biosynthesis